MIKEFRDNYYIKQYLDGNKRAFNKIINHYKRPLFSFIIKMVNNQEQAEDIFQETFMRVIKNLETYKENGKFSSWLFNIAHNLCRDYWRSNSKYSNSSFDTNYEPADAESDISEQLEIIEDRAWLESELISLPEKLREVVLLHVYSGMSFREIAGSMDCSVNTVLGRMHYAKQKLIQKWKEINEKA